MIKKIKPQLTTPLIRSVPSPKRVTSICLCALSCAPIPQSSRWSLQRPSSPHARSTIIKWRQCHLHFRRQQSTAPLGLKGRLHYTIQLLLIRQCIAINQAEMFCRSSVGNGKIHSDFQLRDEPHSSEWKRIERKVGFVRDLLQTCESITSLIYHSKRRKLADLLIKAAYALDMTR